MWKPPCGFQDYILKCRRKNPWTEQSLRRPGCQQSAARGKLPCDGKIKTFSIRIAISAATVQCESDGAVNPLPSADGVVSGPREGWVAMVWVGRGRRRGVLFGKLQQMLQDCLEWLLRRQIAGEDSLLGPSCGILRDRVRSWGILGDPLPRLPSSFPHFLGLMGWQRCRHGAKQQQ